MCGALRPVPRTAAPNKMTKLNIRRFDPATFKKNRAMLCIGKKGTGKSTMVAHLAYLISHYVDNAIAMTPSLSSQETFRMFMPACNVYSDYREDKVVAILTEQRRRQAAGEYVPHIAIFMDDLGYDKSIFTSKVMRDVLMNGRQVNITLLFALQYCLDIKPDIRSNIDYVFAFSEKIGKNRKKLHENFFGMFQTFSSFEKTFFACTENYECLVMDNTAQSNHLDDTVFYFKATLHEKLPEFFLCSPALKKIARHCTRKAGVAEAPAIGDMTYDQTSKITEVVKAAPSKKKKAKSSGPAIEPFYVDAGGSGG